MKKTIKTLFLMLTLCLSANLHAQKDITVSGTVSDETGETLIGVTVIVKNQPGLGTATDIDGKFKIKTGENDILVFSYIGFDNFEIPVKGQNTVNVVMKAGSSQLEEVTIVGAGVQRKVSVVGAITNIEPELLNTPTSNLSNSLAGNVAGIIAMQKTGEPGSNYSEFWIRGISTFGASSSALVLVDGIERDFNQINVEDIESFSILKDASATAIYGQRGANGVVLITTKKGKSGKVNINFKAEYGLATPSRMAKYVDGVQYANLANEARMTRGMDPLYTDSELSIIRNGLDPDIYPNIDWQDELLKNVTSNYRAMINISGGGSTARYYISGGYYNEEGLYKTQLQDYETNANYKRYNFRSNVDVNVTKSTILELGVGGWIVDQNKPGSSSDDIWNSLATLTAISVPKVYSNGLFPTIGTGYNTNPYVLLNETGYKTIWENKIETNIAVRQDLNFITKGLKFYGRFSYDAYNYNSIARLKTPDLYRAEKQRDNKGNLVLTRKVESSPLTQSSETRGDKRYYGEVNITYDRVFNQKHRVGGLLFYYQQEFSRNENQSNEQNVTTIMRIIPRRNLSLSGRATYSFDDRYMLEFNFGYSGSENFQRGDRFGFFPAIAGGWLISNESFIKNNASWLDNLKIRYSYGEVGNDSMKDADGNDMRFPYITQVGGHWNYNFGNMGQTNRPGLAVTRIGTPNLTWEVAKKHNLGIDIGLFNQFTATFEVFKDNRDKILMARKHIPWTSGIDPDPNYAPWANVGKMESKGFDGTFAYNQKISEFDFTIRGNLTYSKSEVLEYDEAANSLYYQQTKGYRWGQSRGLIALGLFEDENDIANSPVHTFDEVMPGDIKYKDVNGDGKIDEADVVPIGYSNVPGLIYGLGFSAKWKGLDFNILFQGSGDCDFFLGGTGVFPFYYSETGNVLKQVANESNRWISREISGTADTERQDVIFPRLSYGENKNNSQPSTWWLRNSRYLRLKNLEIGYTLPRLLTRKWLMESVRIYFVGNNLCVWDNFKWWDPEIASKNGAVYPIQKNFTMGLTVSF